MVSQAKGIFAALVSGLLLVAGHSAHAAAAPPPLPLRHAEGDRLIPPATPLVACDPYFSIWSPADKLTDADTMHWTGKPQRLASLVQIDGKTFRVMGAEPADVPALNQNSLEVLPTRTIYTFEGAGVELTLTFMTAALPEDIDLLSRPVTYVTYDFACDRRKNARRGDLFRGERRTRGEHAGTGGGVVRARRWGNSPR